VTIGEASLELGGEKEEDLNYSGETEWPATSIAGGRP